MDNSETKDQAVRSITGDFTVVWNDLTNRPGWAVLSTKQDGSVVPYFVKDGDILKVFQKIETLWDGTRNETLWPTKDREGLYAGKVTEADLFTTPEAYRLCSAKFQQYTPTEWFGGNRFATVTINQPVRENLGSIQSTQPKVLENV